MPLQRAPLLGRGKKQVVKWTAEGAGKWISRVFCNERASVSCTGYCFTVSSERTENREGKVAPRISKLFVLGRKVCHWAIFILRWKYDNT